MLNQVVPSICPDCIAEFNNKVTESASHPGPGTVGMFCEHRLARVHAIVDHGVITDIAVHACPTLEQACDQAHAAAVAYQMKLYADAAARNQAPPATAH